MTLGEFFTYLNEHPLVMLLIFLGIPVTALLTNWIAAGVGQETPWKYLYALLVYAVSVPGILVTALGIYYFLFEPGGSILNMNLLTQALPVLSMILTLAIIKRNVAFANIPGFGKLSSLMILIVTAFVLMYIMNRLHLIVWVMMPAHYFLIALIGLILILRFALKRVIA